MGYTVLCEGRWPEPNSGPGESGRGVGGQSLLKTRRGLGSRGGAWPRLDCILVSVHHCEIKSIDIYIYAHICFRNYDSYAFVFVVTNLVTYLDTHAHIYVCTNKRRVKLSTLVRMHQYIQLSNNTRKPRNQQTNNPIHI